MGFDQHHEPPEELSEETRTSVRVIQALIVDAEVIDWYTFPDRVLQAETSVPEGRVVISQGARVISADEKHVGNVEQVVADSVSNIVTRFVVRSRARF